tara:strand:- start:18207 stop:19046 length:840 start_codon:yes stop_codon:yes gene_type:complete
MNVAVTGSSGFIGSHLLPKLKKEGHTVTEISRTRNLDITNWEKVKDLKPCEIIVHLAAKTFVPDSFNNPAEFYKTNYIATLHSLELARKWNARVIYMSSYFYGPPQYLPVDEKHILNPHNPYAQSKMQSEQLCGAYFRDFGIQCISFRLFNIYGKGQTGYFLIPEILEKIKNGGTVTLADPRPKRDFIHVNDAVNAIILATNKLNIGFEVFNLGTGVATSVEELVSIIYDRSPIKFKVKFTNKYRKGEILESIACIDKIRNNLNWNPKIDIKKGIEYLF